MCINKNKIIVPQHQSRPQLWRNQTVASAKKVVLIEDGEEDFSYRAIENKGNSHKILLCRTFWLFWAFQAFLMVHVYMQTKKRWTKRSLLWFLWVYLWECVSFRSVWGLHTVCMFHIFSSRCHKTWDSHWPGLGLDLVLDKVVLSTLVL